MHRLEYVLRDQALRRLATLAEQLVLPEGFIHTYVYFGTLPEGVKELAEQQLEDVIVLELLRNWVLSICYGSLACRCC